MPIGNHTRGVVINVTMCDDTQEPHFVPTLMMNLDKDNYIDEATEIFIRSVADNQGFNSCQTAARAAGAVLNFTDSMDDANVEYIFGFAHKQWLLGCAMSLFESAGIMHTGMMLLKQHRLHTAHEDVPTRNDMTETFYQMIMDFMELVPEVILEQFANRQLEKRERKS